ncbi:septal ring lytic transglycosylase RlpA family protein [Methylobacterium sp. Leaf108]|uniref:septal ring lytic transglycosylase RlpA family protein n=1 Tax=Methylobacterium sp. Leaf108 TaxID=1736256 RepID=UPI0012E8C2CE|nr:septal ring lytic transglycosylase RlpA family protein [Methylobacterium sp. Leaf108]
MVRIWKAGDSAARMRPVWRVRPAWRVMAVTALALTTANCAAPTQKLAGGATGSGSEIDPKYGVKASPRLYKEGDVIPKGGGRRFSGKPYVVAGRTYVPREDAKGYVREGLASWYGAAFHGRLTANGEVFDRNSVAAAHPTMPLPSYARVTNLANGHSMVVRVNDRGPYHANRLMDVSEEVASALDFRRRGTAKVRVEYVGKASTAGSDDAKLMATLRTDGQPAAIRGAAPVMLADLGPDAEMPVRASRPAMAFKPAAEVDEPAPRPVRIAPTVVAAASIAVPAAVQPTRVRTAAFVPVRPSHQASANQASTNQASANTKAPMSLAPPPIRLAGAPQEIHRQEIHRQEIHRQEIDRSAFAGHRPAGSGASVRLAAGKETINKDAPRVEPAARRGSGPMAPPSRLVAQPAPPSAPMAGRIAVPPARPGQPAKPALLAGARSVETKPADTRVVAPAGLKAQPAKVAAAPVAAKPRRAQFARVE